MTAPLILHDFFSFPGGGERVALFMARHFAARVVTGHVDVRPFPVDAFEGIPFTNLDAFRAAPLLARFSQTAALRKAFCTLPQQDAPWGIFTGTVSLFAHASVSGRKILYCHTPPRILFDLRRETLAATPAWQRPAMRAFMHWFKGVYTDALGAMDVVLANSENVRQRLLHYLGQDAHVVHPPCMTHAFPWRGQDDYYLSCARLDGLKRVDRIVTAFLSMPERRLVVASGGPEEARLRALAADAPNISFTGWIDEPALIDLMGRAIATIYIPRDEDFGMSPVESMAAGKPVIGVDEGGLRETVVHGETGILLPPDPPPKAIAEAVSSLTPERARAMRQACTTRAQDFSEDAFLRRLSAAAFDGAQNDASGNASDGAPA
ncbi:glycosyltransferase [Desulfobaculum senezii]